MNPLFEYSETGKWTKAYPAHGLGVYPRVCQQDFLDLPVEEAGNMLILTAAVTAIERNGVYTGKHWEILNKTKQNKYGLPLDSRDQFAKSDWISWIVATAAFNVNLNTNSEVSLLTLANVEALAQAENGGSLWTGYMNEIKNCEISETKRCDFEIWVPGIGYCSIGFDYVVKHNGKENPCSYTGNLNNFCDYYRCIRTG